MYAETFDVLDRHDLLDFETLAYEARTQMSNGHMVHTVREAPRKSQRVAEIRLAILEDDDDYPGYVAVELDRRVQRTLWEEGRVQDLLPIGEHLCRAEMLCKIQLEDGSFDAQKWMKYFITDDDDTAFQYGALPKAAEAEKELEKAMRRIGSIVTDFPTLAPRITARLQRIVIPTYTQPQIGNGDADE